MRVLAKTNVRLRMSDTWTCMYWLGAALACKQQLDRYPLCKIPLRSSESLPHVCTGGEQGRRPSRAAVTHMFALQASQHVGDRQWSAELPCEVIIEARRRSPTGIRQESNT